MKNPLIFAGIGFELLGLVLAALYIGQAVDKQMNWPGYGVAGFVVLGLVSWLSHLVFLLKKFMKEDDGTSTKDD